MSHPHTASRKSQAPLAAFTLIELLTVIAIIGILAAIIIPTVGKVRRSAKLSLCLANHRSIATGYLMWLNDNKGKLLFATGTSSPNDYAGSRPMHGAQDARTHPGYLVTALKDYGITPAVYDAGKPIPNRWQTVWYCPVSGETKYGESGIAGHGCTYYYFYLGNAIGKTTEGATLDQVAEFVSRQPFMQDWYGSHDDKSIANPNRWVTPIPANFNPKSKSVYTFLDGHVAYRKPPTS